MDVNCETVFLKELQKNKCIILTKENTRSAREKKRLAWMTIQRTLVATSGREYSVQQLCKKWNNLQQRVKEKIRNTNSGGDKVAKTLHERDLLCLQIIGPENLNIPLGPFDLNYSNLPEVKSESHCHPEENGEGNNILDIMMCVNQQNNNMSPSLVMNSNELKNNLVTSLTSLHNSMTTPAVTTASCVYPGPVMSPGSADITLQDFDNIQTNIFAELANRISQINNDNHLLNNTDDVICVTESDHHQPAGSAKRKRRSSNLSYISETNDINQEILELKREVLQLKKEKLLLENEKTKLLIESLKSGTLKGECHVHKSIIYKDKLTQTETTTSNSVVDSNE